MLGPNIIHSKLFCDEEIEPVELSIIKEADNAQELRNKWERIWMARLNSYVPYGMNILD